VQLVVVPAEVDRWNHLVTEHHYLHSARLVGEQLRYVVSFQGHWLALLGWSAPAYHLKGRDHWLGWTEPQRRTRLHLLAQNSRFVILADRGDWPNLASRALTRVTQQLSADWQQAYGHPLAVVESFVDSQLFRGTAYKASHWTVLGQTAGFERVAEDFYTRHDRPKQLWVKALVPEAPACLAAPTMPAPWQAYEKAVPARCGVASRHLPSLRDGFAGLTDPRGRQGKRHPLPTIFALIACAKLGGVSGGYRALHTYAASLSQPQRKHLRCWYNPRTQVYDVPGESSFFRALRLVTPKQIQAVLDPWLDAGLGPASRDELVAIDGKALNHSGLHLVSAISVPSLRCLGTVAVADKTNEIVALRELVDGLDLAGRLVGMDALHTQDETVRKLLYDKGADYRVVLKDNPPTLLATAQNALPQATAPLVVRVEDNRGRRERRALVSRPVTAEQLGLAGAEQIAQIQRTRQGTGATFVKENLLQPSRLIAKLLASGTSLAKTLWAALPVKIRKTLAVEHPPESAAPVVAAMVRALNQVAAGPALCTTGRFRAASLAADTRALRAQPPTKGQRLAQLNRLVLRDAYPAEISTAPTTETVWLAASRSPAQLGPEAFLDCNRVYWGIENGAHQRLDCSLFEDRLRVRDPNAATVLGLLHRLSLPLALDGFKTRPNIRDRTYPTWQARHAGNRWRLIRKVMDPVARRAPA